MQGMRVVTEGGTVLATPQTRLAYSAITDLTIFSSSFSQSVGISVWLAEMHLLSLLMHFGPYSALLKAPPYQLASRKIHCEAEGLFYA